MSEAKESKINSDIKPHKCDDCQTSFCHKRSLKRHKKAVHDKIKDYKCNHCNKEFSFRYRLKTHVT